MFVQHTSNTLHCTATAEYAKQTCFKKSWKGSGEMSDTPLASGALKVHVTPARLAHVRQHTLFWLCMPSRQENKCHPRM